MVNVLKVSYRWVFVIPGSICLPETFLDISWFRCEVAWGDGGGTVPWTGGASPYVVGVSWIGEAVPWPEGAPWVDEAAPWLVGGAPWFDKTVP